MTTGERMKERRKALGISAEYVAEKLGVSPATIYRYEKGDIEKMPGNVLEPISRILSTTPAYLMGWAEPSISSSTMELTPAEAKLVVDYRELNAEGQKAALTMMAGLVAEPIYKKRDNPSDILDLG